MSQPLDPYPSPHPPAPSTSEQRNWAMAAHLGSFVAAWMALGLLAPLLVMLTKGDESAYIRRHSVESLNFQLSVLIYSIAGTFVAFVLAIVTFGLGLLVIIPLVAVFGLAYVVLVIFGSVKASRGEDFRYPLTLRLVT